MKELQDILALFRRHRGEPMALATLVQTTGSSYRRPGARMLITPQTQAGSLSGGCLEEEIAAVGRKVLQSGIPQLLHIDTRARYGCHGALEVCVEHVSDDFLAAVDAACQARIRCEVATFYGDGELGGSRVCDPDEPLPGAFIQCLEPCPRLVIIGSGPETISLAAFAQVLGWEVEHTDRVCEIRGALDAFTAVVIGTHNYGRDFAALQMLMPAPVAYLGLIGSRRRRDQLLCDLMDGNGEMPAGLHGPAGLDLGAETPEEIALAIVAEIQATLGHGNAQPLCRRNGPIHAAKQRPSIQPALVAAR